MSLSSLFTRSAQLTNRYRYGRYFYGILNPSHLVPVQLIKHLHSTFNRHIVNSLFYYYQFHLCLRKNGGLSPH